MTAKLYFVEGDTLAVPEATIADAAGVPVDLTGQTVTFTMIDYWSKAVVIDAGPVTVLQDANDASTTGQVYYKWQSAAEVARGLYSAWFVLHNGSAVEHFPADDKGLFIKIAPKYGS